MSLALPQHNISTDNSHLKGMWGPLIASWGVREDGRKRGSKDGRRSGKREGTKKGKRDGLMTEGRKAVGRNLKSEGED